MAAQNSPAKRTLRQRLSSHPKELYQRAFNLLFGRPLANEENHTQRVSAISGVPILGLDALASAAYGPEAALTVLGVLGATAPFYAARILAAIVLLLAIVYVSYRQTIAAYPNGGGSFTVASENLGRRAGHIAAASLLTDYTLNVAVGISAGVGAIESALPSLQPHRLAACLVILLVVSLINLRGVRESGLAWSLPTFGFVLTLCFIICLGIWKSISDGDHPRSLGAAPLSAAPTAAVSWWLILRAFANGCTAMTGIEAVSNGVPIFAHPRTRNARRSLTIIATILAFLLLGIGFLAERYGITARTQERPGYESVVSQLVAAVVGRNTFYYITIGFVLTVLALSANTSFADFPRLCGILAEKGDLPPIFGAVGRRLVHSTGIIILTIGSAALLIVFGGVTDRLIPLFAVGAFTAFTMSQLGMVVHWRRERHRLSLPQFLNAMGALATAATVIVVVVAKFSEGAWIVMLVIPLVTSFLEVVHRYYDRVRRIIADPPVLEVSSARAPVVIVPIQEWNRISERAMRFALRISDEIVAVHVVAEEADPKFSTVWIEKVAKPSEARGIPIPELQFVVSPYRQFYGPLLDFVDRIAAERPQRTIAVVIPELVRPRWWKYLLHNQPIAGFKAALLLKGAERIVVISTPWYLRDEAS